MKQLRVSETLALPLGIANKTICLFGKGGSGKSNLEVVLAEELYAAGIPTCILDPADIHYGIKSTADGKHPGAAFIVFGGLHADHEIFPDMGVVMADLFLDQGLFMIIVTQQWTGGERSRFMTDFANQLYKRGPEKESRGSARVLIIEEAHEYVPLNPGKGEEVMLGAMKRLYTVGRNYWIGFIAATRRPAKLHTDLRNGADATAFFQIVGTQDRKAMTDYLGEMAEKDVRDEILSHLAKLPVGEAYWYQPHEQPAVQRVHFRKRHTLDTTTTEIPVGHKAIKPVLAEVDLSKLGEALAAARERAKENDPRELRRWLALANQRIEELERRQPTIQERVVEKIINVYSVPPHLIDMLKTWNEQTRRALDEPLLWKTETQAAAGAGLAQTAEQRVVNPTVDGTVGDMRGKPRQAPLQVVDTHVGVRHPAAPAASVIRTAPAGSSVHPDLKYPQKKILDALAWLEYLQAGSQHWTIVAMLSDQSPKSSGFKNNVSVLRVNGFLEGNRGSGLSLTDRGRRIAVAPDAPLSTDALLKAVEAKVTQPQNLILRYLAGRSEPFTASWDKVAEYTLQSPTSSGFKNNVSVLRSMGLIRGNKAKGLTAEDVVFVGP